MMTGIMRGSALILLAIFVQACERTDEPAVADSVAAVQATIQDAPGSPDNGGLAAMLAGDHRSPENTARDKYRHPAETLGFFGLRPDSTVVEIWPGAGWYTEIIAPYVREQGKFIAAGFDPDSEVDFIRAGVAKYRAKLDERPDLYDRVEMTVLMPPDKYDFAAPASVDLILTFRSIHNWMPRDVQGEMLAAMYKALKPGGVLGVVEHRGIPSEPQDPKAASGYVNQEYAIEMIERAGFVLNGSSEINANPADTKDHPEGVWTLPPTLRLGAQDKDKYLAIGESDRFTLRFVKPEK
ncbi:MAG: methyltransferase [Gammaproteobacteria bacterium]|jgi:predicted methyltransferase